MIDAEAISYTLEQVAEKIGDPAPLVFDALFARYPHYEEMFVMDTDGGVRGSMLETCINCLLGVAKGDRNTPRLLIEASRLSHDGFGLEEDEIDRVFPIMRDVFRKIMADQWTEALAAEWEKLLAEMTELGSKANGDNALN